MKIQTFIAVITILLFTLGLQTTNNAYGVVTTPTFLDIDVSARPTANGDYAFGLTCDDPTYRYASIFSSGAILRITKADNSYTIFDNNAIAAGEDWYSTVQVLNANKVYSNEKDTGKLQVFNTLTNTFGTPIP